MRLLLFDGKDSTALLWVKTGAEATFPSLAATLSSKCRQQQKMILSCYSLYLDKFIKNVLVDDRTYEQDATRHWRFTGSAELDRMPRFYIYLNTWKMTDRSKWLQSILLWLTDWSKLLTQFSFAGESHLMMGSWASEEENVVVPNSVTSTTCWERVNNVLSRFSGAVSATNTQKTTSACK